MSLQVLVKMARSWFTKSNLASLRVGVERSGNQWILNLLRVLQVRLGRLGKSSSTLLLPMFSLLLRVIMLSNSGILGPQKNQELLLLDTKIPFSALHSTLLELYLLPRVVIGRYDCSIHGQVESLFESLMAIVALRDRVLFGWEIEIESLLLGSARCRIGNFPSGKLAR